MGLPSPFDRMENGEHAYCRLRVLLYMTRYVFSSQSQTQLDNCLRRRALHILSASSKPRTITKQIYIGDLGSGMRMLKFIKLKRSRGPDDNQARRPIQLRGVPIAIHEAHHPMETPLHTAIAMSIRIAELRNAADRVPMMKDINRGI